MVSLFLTGKNGVYSELAKNVREAFEECELVRINCTGMNGSDYRKIGAKLKVCYSLREHFSCHDNFHSKAC